MSEPLMSVAGQLVGIPAEKYSGINGITVDQNNKTIGLDEPTYYYGYNATSGGVFKAKAHADIVTDVHACRIGNLVMINGQINPMAKITFSTGWTYIGTVNDELKPSSDVLFPFTCVETQFTGAMKIATNGQLSIQQSNASQNGFGRFFSVAYSTGGNA